ncbi:MAG: DUF4833 domain-containing protein [Cyclobacteriaceae bacterium]
MRLILGLLFLNIYLSGFGQIESSQNLFLIKRSKDADKVYYSVNLDEQGNLSLSDPIKTYWIRHAKDGEHEPLTWVQEHFSYGLEYLSIDKEEVRFQFVSYSKQKLILKKAQGGYTVYMMAESGLLELKEIFVQIDGGPFMLPSIPYVKVTTCRPETNHPVTQIITP